MPLTLPPSPGIAGLPRDIPNILNSSFAGGADHTGVLDSSAAVNAALASSSNNGGTFGPHGFYKCIASRLDSEGVDLWGESMEGTKFSFPSDFGVGQQCLTHQKTQTATKPLVGAKQITVQGPALSSARGTYPSQCDGIRIGNAAHIWRVQSSGCRSAANLFKDHENIEHCRLTGGIGLLLDKTQSGGDQWLIENTFSGCLVAAIGVHPDSNGGGMKIWGDHLGFTPVSMLKFRVQGGAGAAPGMYTATFTGTIGGDGVSVTGIAGTVGTPVNGMRVDAAGVPEGTSMSAYNSGAGTLMLSAASTPGAGITFYVDTTQVEHISAAWVYACSFESYGNGIMIAQPSGIKCEAMVFRDCGASNPMDSGTRIAGFPTEAPFNNITFFHWTLDNVGGILAVGDVCVFRTGSGGTNLSADLGDLATIIDAVNAAGKKLTAPVSAGGVNWAGTKFTYGSGGIGSSIEGQFMAVESGSVAVSDLLCNVDSRVKVHTGVAATPTHSVALGAGTAGTNIPVARRGAIKVKTAGAAIAATAHVKPDPANPGSVTTGLYSDAERCGVSYAATSSSTTGIYFPR